MALDTFEKQAAYYESRWPELEQAIADEGSQGLRRVVAETADATERRVLYMFARRGLLKVERPDRLDLLMDLAEDGKEMLGREINDPATDDETRMNRRRTQRALLYNLTADLAECWPDDPQRRERHQLERGLEAANEALALNEVLGNPPGVYAGDWWARGMHELSLGQAAAVASFKRALEHAQVQAEADGATGEVSADAPFLVLLNAAYLGIAARHFGFTEADYYDKACAAFEAQKAEPAKQGDAEFGLEQIRFVAERFAPR